MRIEFRIPVGVVWFIRSRIWIWNGKSWYELREMFVIQKHLP